MASRCGCRRADRGGRSVRRMPSRRGTAGAGTTTGDGRTDESVHVRQRWDDLPVRVSGRTTGSRCPHRSSRLRGSAPTAAVTAPQAGRAKGVRRARRAQCKHRACAGRPNGVGVPPNLPPAGQARVPSVLGSTLCRALRCALGGTLAGGTLGLHVVLHVVVFFGAARGRALRTALGPACRGLRRLGQHPRRLQRRAGQR
jgi:hypothetical protein